MFRSGDCEDIENEIPGDEYSRDARDDFDFDILFFALSISTFFLVGSDILLFS